MGGDYGPPVTIPASLGILPRYPDLKLILVGDQEVLLPILKQYKYDKTRVEVVHASQNVEMDEPPASALKNKKDSSMRIALNLVKEGRAQACVSSGNTGALMAIARFVLKTLPGIDRPAIISGFPTLQKGKCVRMLDLGANVDSSAENLVQFAIMGSVLAREVDNLANPRVSLLNIGEEEIKGNEQVKKTAQILAQASYLNYAGFIEGDELYSGTTDVIVCDGFVGNVALKTAEGVATYISTLIKRAFNRNAFTKAIGILARPIFKTFAKRIDPANFNGATFIGLQGTVIKSHGGATIKGFANAIKEAIVGVQKNVPDRIRNEVELILKSIPPTEE